MNGDRSRCIDARNRLIGNYGETVLRRIGFVDSADSIYARVHSCLNRVGLSSQCTRSLLEERIDYCWSEAGESGYIIRD